MPQLVVFYAIFRAILALRVKSITPGRARAWPSAQATGMQYRYALSTIGDALASMAWVSKRLLSITRWMRLNCCM